MWWLLPQHALPPSHRVFFFCGTHSTDFSLIVEKTLVCCCFRRAQFQCFRGCAQPIHDRITPIICDLCTLQHENGDQVQQNKGNYSEPVMTVPLHRLLIHEVHDSRAVHRSNGNGRAHLGQLRDRNNPRPSPPLGCHRLRKSMPLKRCSRNRVTGCGTPRQPTRWYDCTTAHSLFVSLPGNDRAESASLVPVRVSVGGGAASLRSKDGEGGGSARERRDIGGVPGVVGGENHCTKHTIGGQPPLAVLTTSYECVSYFEFPYNICSPQKAFYRASSCRLTVTSDIFSAI